MAGAESKLKEMEDIITCSICRELFTDARTLTCQHCFCLVCLQQLQTTTLIKPCPICREDTIPPARELHRLPANRTVNDMVGFMIKQKGGTVPQKKSIPPPAYEPRNVPNKPTTPPKATPKPQPTAAQKPTVRAASPPGISLADLLGGVRQERQRREEARAEAIAGAIAEAFAEVILSDTGGGNIHRGVTCDECSTDNFRGARYKCGVCEDYDLCEGCYRKPRLIVHDMKHIFIKLRRPVTRRIPRGQVLDPVGFWMGQKMNFGSNVHSVVLTANLIGLAMQVQAGIPCDKCGEKPIRGIRYKCGMCNDYDLCGDCEQQCSSFHPSSHVFLAIPHPSASKHEAKRLLRCEFY